MVSVVFKDSDGNIEWPLIPARGVLAVPRSCKTVDEWERKYGYLRAV